MTSLLYLAVATDPALEATARAQRVIDRFYSAVQSCGGPTPAKPALKAGVGRGIVQYDPTGTIIVFPWEGMDAGTQAALTALAASRASKLGGRETYLSIFNELLVAHELGHWLQAGKLDNDRWQSEYNANQIMIAFWREYPEGRSTRVRFAEYFSFVPGRQNPLPPPRGTSTRDYFNSNYVKLQQSPAYGWYQNISGKLANAEHPRPRFCSLVMRSLNGR